MDRVVLLDRQGRKWLVPLEGDTLSVPGLGVLKTEKVSAALGGVLAIGGQSFYVLRPSARDFAETLERKAQIITAKDAALLLYYADVKPGDTVVEGGSGSGALTIALARAVGPDGHVFSYDIREDFLAVARENVRRAGLSDRVQFRHGDIRQGIEGLADAITLDILDPWNAVHAAYDGLRPCGHLATYSPNMEQVKETVLTVEKLPFIEVRTVELLEREMEVREHGVRPAFAALGHTGYLTVARKVLSVR
ncbi:MAG TPA: tRNA (adenine-N1)-methyltransferase [Thermoplasmata archaeon]|nr:tRNA (adenine-N1)-methyltransferase [Thermoplasmata archaeon]